MTFGERLKKVREQRGLTIRELARRAKVSAAAISRLESGVRDSPSVEFAKKVAFVLGVTIDYLAGMYEDMGSEYQPAAVA